MKAALEWLFFLGIFAACNVVGAGVIVVLGLQVEAAAPGWDSTWPWFPITACGVVAAVLFLRGAFACIAERSLLQYRHGRRGG